MTFISGFISRPAKKKRIQVFSLRRDSRYVFTARDKVVISGRSRGRVVGVVTFFQRGLSVALVPLSRLCNLACSFLSLLLLLPDAAFVALSLFFSPSHLFLLSPGEAMLRYLPPLIRLPQLGSYSHSALSAALPVHAQ